MKNALTRTIRFNQDDIKQALRQLPGVELPPDEQLTWTLPDVVVVSYTEACTVSNPEGGDEKLVH